MVNIKDHEKIVNIDEIDLQLHFLVTEQNKKTMDLFIRTREIQTDEG
jgi:hypothetical protein